jgi:hypothetical protein
LRKNASLVPLNFLSTQSRHHRALVPITFYAHCWSHFILLSCRVHNHGPTMATHPLTISQLFDFTHWISHVNRAGNFKEVRLWSRCRTSTHDLATIVPGPCSKSNQRSSLMDIGMANWQQRKLRLQDLLFPIYSLKSTEIFKVNLRKSSVHVGSPRISCSRISASSMRARLLAGQVVK